MHDYSSDANIGYKDINAQLDKYTRAFDVIDILYQTLRTSLNVYNTYETVSDRIGDYKDMLEDFNKKCLERGNIVSTVSDRIGDYKDMLEDFNKKCLERGNIVSTDTLIITINARALAKIADEGDNLYKSVSDLVLYATGAAACSTSDLILVLCSINQSLDNIKKHLNKAYFDTWKYIQVRIGYWKPPEQSLLRHMEIHPGSYRILETSGVSC